MKNFCDMKGSRKTNSKKKTPMIIIASFGMKTGWKMVKLFGVKSGYTKKYPGQGF